MDTSQPYIKMCEKAGEIHKDHLESGDYYAYYCEDWKQTDLTTKKFTASYKFGIFYELLRGQTSDELNLYLNLKDNHKSILIWLPRQDQLQEMLNHTAVVLGIMFANWLRANEGWYFCFKSAPIPSPSMEQLWLAFVMKEKYAKVWDGENWVKEK